MTYGQIWCQCPYVLYVYLPNHQECIFQFFDRKRSISSKKSSRWCVWINSFWLSGLRFMLTTLKQTTNQASIVLKARPDRKFKNQGHDDRFFDFRGVVHYEFLPPGKTVNRDYNLSAMHRLRKAIRLKRPELWAQNWFTRSSCPFRQ